MDDLATRLKHIEEKYPLIPHTGAGMLFSLVRRMTAEKKYNIPIPNRTGFGISVKLRKAANKMTEEEWEVFYHDSAQRLKRDYPELYSRIEEVD